MIPLAVPLFLVALVDGLGQELVGGRVGQEFAAAGEFDPRWYDWSLLGTAGLRHGTST